MEYDVIIWIFNGGEDVNDGLVVLADTIVYHRPDFRLDFTKVSCQMGRKTYARKVHPDVWDFNDCLLCPVDCRRWARQQ